MATAMEKMVASMLGISPEEMQAMLTGFQDLFKNLAGKLDEIREVEQANSNKLDAIIERMESVGTKPNGKRPASNGGSGSAPAPIGSTVE